MHNTVGISRMNWVPPVLSSSRLHQPLWSGPGVDDRTGFYCTTIPSKFGRKKTSKSPSKLAAKIKRFYRNFRYEKKTHTSDNIHRATGEGRIQRDPTFQRQQKNVEFRTTEIVQPGVNGGASTALHSIWDGLFSPPSLLSLLSRLLFHGLRVYFPSVEKKKKEREKKKTSHEIRVDPKPQLSASLAQSESRDKMKKKVKKNEFLIIESGRVRKSVENRTNREHKNKTKNDRSKRWNRIHPLWIYCDGRREFVHRFHRF